MAERRMFAKTIIDSDAFLDMPLSSQALYFHLSMRADDEGFINNPKKTQRMIGCNDDDLKLLIAKSFIIPFESGIVVIKHWKIHNYIRGDRLKETVYQEERMQLIEKDNGAYSIVLIGEKELSKRQKAYKESSLPSSFDYKIRQAFYGEICPVCESKMQTDVEDGIITEFRMPTIQHNLPISKNGKHELGNISVICKQCNITLQDKPTGDLNAQQVLEKWLKIDKKITDSTCQSNVSQKSAQVRLGKVRLELGKDRLGESEEKTDQPQPSPCGKLSFGKFKNVLLSDEDLENLKKELGEANTDKYIKKLDMGIAEKGYKTKNHYVTIKKWFEEDRQKNNDKPPGGGDNNFRNLNRFAE